MDTWINPKVMVNKFFIPKLDKYGFHLTYDTKNYLAQL